MRKTITAVARDAAFWREHKRRQRSGEQDETRLKGVTPARLDDGERYDKRHPHEAIIEQTLCDNAHTIFAKREDSQVKQRFGDCALTRDEQCDARDSHKHRHPYERQLETGNFPSKRRLGPKVFHLGAEKERPSNGGATMSRKPPYASFAPAVGPGEQVKSSSTCTSTPPFAVIGAPIAAKQPSAHAFNSSNCSPSLM